MSEPALDIKNLIVELGDHTIIDNVSFAVPAGQTCAIIGPNGAGKSVLIKAIMRLLPKTSGDVTIFGTSHEQYKKVAADVSYVPQRLEFDRDFPLTVHGLFALKSKQPIGISKSDHDHMLGLLDMVGMRDHLNEKLSHLSGGQLQRVLIAYSLMDKPKLLILDEPAAGIDVTGQDNVYTLLERIQDQEQLTMIMISHEIDVVMQYADQVICLNKQLLCAGLPHEALTTEVMQEMYGAPTAHFHHDANHTRHA